MATIDYGPTDRTLEAIDAAIVEREKKREPRGHLGFSVIGNECDRRLWYSFRWAHREELSATTLKMFEDGHRGEELIAQRLRLVPGIQLHTIDETTGAQIRFSDHGGHFGGSCDGMVLGLLEAPKTWHVWEHKVSAKAEKLHEAVQKHGEDALAFWNPVYYVQAQLYMHYSGVDRHWLTADTPGGRATYSARTKYDKTVAERVIARAGRVIQSPRPLERVSEDPSWFVCKFCPVSKVCRGETMAGVNCRTCAHSTPDMSGTGARWVCEKHKKNLTIKEQLAGCADHVYIPDLMKDAGYGDPVDGDMDKNWIEYQVDSVTVRNGTLHEAQGAGAVHVLPSSTIFNIAPEFKTELLSMIYRVGPTEMEIAKAQHAAIDRDMAAGKIATISAEAVESVERHYQVQDLKQSELNRLLKNPHGRTAKRGRKTIVVDERTGQEIS